MKHVTDADDNYDHVTTRVAGLATQRGTDMGYVRRECYISYPKVHQFSVLS